ncbi:MAG: sulfatase-like hydrolase/transferase [Balneolaceae bacterium]|nr:sulfatase-like hydrolase/transferase [Balneolaceae bacterium]
MNYLYTLILSTFLISLAFQNSSAQDAPQRAILLIIDGLHVDAPEKLEMPNYNQLASQGTLIEKTCGIMPYHPTHGEYASIHTSSYPNPVMMAGTVFLKPGQDFMQHSFETSAFIANTTSYRSISGGYEYAIQKSGTDAFAVDQAVDILENHDPAFMRVHMQSAGGAGFQSFSDEEGQPYKYAIWHEDSPYVQAIEEADRQLGRFISELKKIGKWKGTLLVVTADHGQTKTGWHPILPEESWLFPTLFHGPRVKENHTMEWADQIDLVPTIAHMMEVDAPNSDGGSGRILHNLIRSGKDGSTLDSRLLKLNRVLARYIKAEAELLSHASEYPYLNSLVMILEREFYGLNRILDWSDFRSIEALIENNEQVVTEMEQKLNEMGISR